MEVRKLTALIGIAAVLVSCTRADSDITNPDIPVFRTVSVHDFIRYAGSEQFFNIKGSVLEITDHHFSEFRLSDGTDTVCVCGLWDGMGGDRLQDMDGISIGDKISIAALPSYFKGKVEARRAFCYDPSKANLWIETSEAQFESDGGIIAIKASATGTITLQHEADWIKATYENEYINIEVQANTGFETRSCYINVNCENTSFKIRVAQSAADIPILKISDALRADRARVIGCITAITPEGFVLSDSSGSIFVNSSFTLGKRVGAEMDVYGTIATRHSRTSIEAEIIVEKGNSTYKIDKYESFSLQDAEALDPGNLNLKPVCINGDLVAGEGGYRINDFKTGKTIAYIEESVAVSIEAYVYKYVGIDGFLSTYSNGKLYMIPAGIREERGESEISVDGSFEDWTGIEGYTQSNDNNVYELKLYASATDIYIYFKMRLDAITEFGQYKYFMQIYFNVDNDETTGPYAWGFKGLDTTAYMYIMDGTGFATSGAGGLIYDFVNGDGQPFISANASLFAGKFSIKNDAHSCAGKMSEGYAEFECTYGLNEFAIARHTTIGAGLRLCHEGPNTPSGEQENFFIPTDGFWNYTLE